ncbi:unnamed protein product, partial [Adineta steineri]
MGFHPNTSHELIIQTLAQSDKEIQSYPSTSAGYRDGALIVAR